MRISMNGKFIAMIDIDYQKRFEESLTENEHHLIIQQIVMDKIHKILEKTREEHGLIFAFMPQYINGGPAKL